MLICVNYVFTSPTTELLNHIFAYKSSYSYNSCALGITPFIQFPPGRSVLCYNLRHIYLYPMSIYVGVAIGLAPPTDGLVQREMSMTQARVILQDQAAKYNHMVKDYKCRISIFSVKPPLSTHGIITFRTQATIVIFGATED